MSDISAGGGHVFMGLLLNLSREDKLTEYCIYLLSTCKQQLLTWRQPRLCKGA